MAIKKKSNPNHPKPGDVIKVDPIRDRKAITTIKKLLADHPRNFALFVLGINTNLRASDLLKITAGMVRYCKVGDEMVLKEQKTGKERRITLNQSVVEAIQPLLKSKESDSDLLFTGQRGPLTVPTVNALVKSWCREINLKGNYGSHTLRKTFGYHQRQRGTDIPTLMEMFNHSSQKQTLGYLGIQKTEIKEAYLRINL